MVVVSPFAGRNDGVKIPGCKAGDPFYYDYKINLIYVESGNVDPVTKEMIAVASPKVSITKKRVEDVVNSHRNECGLKNLIKIFARTGDSSLFNQKTPLPDGDYTDVFKDVNKLYASLPEELKAGMTLDEFMISFNMDKFKQYLTDLKAKTEETKEGDNNE